MILEIGKIFAKCLIVVGSRFPKKRRLKKTKLLQDRTARRIINQLRECRSFDCLEGIQREIERQQFDIFDNQHISNEFTVACTRVNEAIKSKIKQEVEENKEHRAASSRLE